MDTDAMFAGILLEPEQKELLTLMVEADRKLPRNERDIFALYEYDQGSFIEHRGFASKLSNVHPPDLRILASRGFLTQNRNEHGTTLYSITPEGFAYYEYLKKSMGKPTVRIESTIKSYLEADAFRAKYPQAYDKWSEAENMLWGSDSEHQLTTIGHLLREAIQAFATALVEKYEPPNVEQEKQKTVSRIRSVLNLMRERLGTTEAAFLDALLVYWGTVSDLIQRQEHGNQRSENSPPLVWEDARRAVFQAAVLMFEVDRSLSRLR